MLMTASIALGQRDLSLRDLRTGGECCGNAFRFAQKETGLLWPVIDAENGGS